MKEERATIRGVRTPALTTGSNPPRQLAGLLSARRGLASIVVAAITGPLLPAQTPTPGPAPTCDGSQSTVVFSVSSSRTLGRIWTAIPAEANAIKIVVTVPANKNRDAEGCGLGDERVDAGTCPAKGKCSGFTIRAGTDAGLDTCHEVDQTLGPYDWPIAQADGVKLDFNAVTVQVSTARVELTCKR